MITLPGVFVLSFLVWVWLLSISKFFLLKHSSTFVCPECSSCSRVSSRWRWRFFFLLLLTGSSGLIHHNNLHWLVAHFNHQISVKLLWISYVFFMLLLFNFIHVTLFLVTINIQYNLKPRCMLKIYWVDIYIYINYGTIKNFYNSEFHAKKQSSGSLSFLWNRNL